MKKKNKAEEFLFILLVILLPSQLGKHFWPSLAFISGIRIDYLSPTIYFTDLVIAAYIFLSVYGFVIKRFSKKKSSVGKNQKKKTLTLPTSLILLLAFAGINTIFSINKLVSLYSWFRVLELIALFTCLKISSKSTINKFYKVLPIPVIYSSILAILQTINKGSIGGILYWLGERRFSLSTPGIAKATINGKLFLRPYATFPHPNSLAGFILVSLILLMLIENDYINQKLKFAAFFLGALALILTLSQACWLTAIFIAILVIFNKKIRKKSILIAAIPIVLGLAIVNFPLEKESVSQRLSAAKQAIIIAKLNPALGVGLGSYIPALQKETKVGYFSTSPFLYFQPVHNVFLLAASETGIIGALLLSGILIASLKSAQRKKHRGIIFSLIAVVLTGMTDHYWLTLYQNRIFLTILLAIAWRNNR